MLSKYLADILKISFLDFNTYAVKDSFTFSEQINNLQLPEGYIVISLDVVSLFTNISEQLTMSVIEGEWDLIRPNTSLPLQEFKKIIHFIFKNNYFMYNSTCYSQIFGCPMGSNLSPILAAIVMSKLLKTSIPKLSYQLPFIYQYVDDLILSVPSDGVQEILNTFNSFNDYIQFTVEMESERAVPFLDTKVIRDENNIILLDWYQKPTSSGRYIHYRSYHDMKMKTNTIMGMKNRILKICHPTVVDEALRRLFVTLRDNGYPDYVLNRLIYSVPRRLNITLPVFPQISSDSLQNLGVSTSVLYASLPYIDYLTQKVIKLLKTVDNVKIAKYNLKTGHKLFSKLKDKLPLLSAYNVIYEVLCEDCQRPYVGQTSQSLKQRLALHRSDSRLRPGRCALASHIHESGHCMQYEQTKILSTEHNYQKRLFLEMCYINERENPLNSRVDIHNLSQIYCYLLELDLIRLNHNENLNNVEDISFQ